MQTLHSCHAAGHKHIPHRAALNSTTTIPVCMAWHHDDTQHPTVAVQSTSTTGPVLTAVAAAAISAVIVPPAAAELYNALQPKRCKCCVGTGFILCTDCQGRGKTGLTLPGAVTTSHRPCPTCAKRGRCQCTECDGSGLENWWLWQPAQDPGWGPRGH